MRFRLTDDQRALREGVREVFARRFDGEALRAAVDRADGAGAGSGSEGRGAVPGAGDGADGSGPGGGAQHAAGGGSVLGDGAGRFGSGGGRPAEGPGGAGGVRAARVDRGLWRDLGELGFFALRLPESEGGVGLGLPEAVLVFAEAGRMLLPGPLVATHLAAGAVPGAATGETVVAAVDGGLVEWLAEADVVRGDATGAVALRSIDPLTPLHRVPARRAAADPVAILLTAAEQLGTATRVCELAAQHARAREQFGRPVGAFQAVAHLCAGILVRVETARAAVHAAAVTGDPADIAAARLLADEAAVRGARDCLQVHGGMGFTWESEVHLHLKRAWVRTQRAGGVTESEELLAAALASETA
ncbi:acyl-CoA dehydrogenase family protein [Streptomyces indiaensis]|uniref:acyl-CoA dehydrogenase family protein n=1 Tax=Streptomyces indiaensis TaxID=284033 RepID=UPI001F257A8D|nr:acyl-CoA dehydrogenase family protein [Streptomyces indiaensis]MCF1648564.1 acyl-CoA dehydrogenase family protein [Streptomyces indiaensis]